MLKYFIVFLILIANTFLANKTFSQEAVKSDSEKRVIYDQEQKNIEAVENEQQYHGDDEIIRNRLNLPPKLKEYSLWVKDFDALASKPDVKAEVKDEAPIQKEQSVIPSVSPDVYKQDSNVGGNDDGKSLLTYDSSLVRLIGFIFLTGLYVLNFVAFRIFKNLRPFLIPIPFTSSAEGQKEETNGQKNIIELGLLAASIFISAGLVYVMGNNQNNPMTILEMISTVCFLYFTVHIGFLAARLFFAYTTRCPKCKTTFARKVLNTYNEPKSNYTKIIKSTNSSRPEYHEVGLRHSDCVCTVCSYEWHIAKSYDRITGTQY